MEHKLEFNFYFSSIGLEESYNGLAMKVEKCHFVYDGQNIENSIFIKYNISSLDWDPVLSQEEITQLVVSEADLFVETFSLFLINPCKLLTSKFFVDGIEFKPTFPVQSLDNIFNLLVERNKLSAGRHITTSVHRDGWAILEKLITEFRSRVITNKNKIRLVLRWCAKASNEYSSIDRLVSYWISFNSLFEGLDDSERRSIERYVERNVDPQLAQRFCVNFRRQLSILASMKIELRNRRKVSDDLNILLCASEKDYVSIVKMTLLVIYGIRNNLFHGNYAPDSSETNRNIVIAEKLLSEFMKEAVAKEMLGYCLESSTFRVRTAVGIG